MSRLRDMWEWSCRVGTSAVAYRLAGAAQRRMGLDVHLAPVHQPTLNGWLPPAVADLAHESVALTEWFHSNRLPSFFPDFQQVRNFCYHRLTDAQRARLVERGQRASRGRILAFRGWEADFGHPPDWRLNPATGAHWPDVHARRLLTKANIRACGDIKFTWEIGRFLHVPDIVRAYILSGDQTLIERLLEQVRDFDQANAVHQGPHWVSEQEVAIRVCMLAFLLEVLPREFPWPDNTLAILLRQVVAGAEYCLEHHQFARYCIANNHFLAAMLALEVGAHAAPWHPQAPRWRRVARERLEEILATQWWPDGAYVQPSHNYHRVALSYLLWILRLRESGGDHAGAQIIRQRFGAPLRLLEAMMDPLTGYLPNWGPNDGAMFFPCSECAYADFRPLLTCLGYAVDGRRRFAEGPWDEQLLWLWGPTAIEAPHRASELDDASFPHAGLHVLRERSAKTFAVLRCGPVLSRYGQQADQLHVDLWHSGENLLLDTGSYSYAAPAEHEWFRSTDAHNTVVVGEQSQMRPYTQFMFLQWPRAHRFQTSRSFEGIRNWHGGWHDGYRRLPRPVLHGRLLMAMEYEGHLVVDLLATTGTDEPAKVVLRWHMLHEPQNLTSSGLRLDIGGRDMAMRWCVPGLQFPEVETAQHEPPSGWHARFYGRRDPCWSLRLSTTLRTDTLLLTWIGPAPYSLNLTCEASGHLVHLGDQTLDLAPFMAELRNHLQ